MGDLAPVPQQVGMQAEICCSAGGRGRNRQERYSILTVILVILPRLRKDQAYLTDASGHNFIFSYTK